MARKTLTGRPVRPGHTQTDFITSANRLVALAWNNLRHGDCDEALENAYRAALRLAGARSVNTMPARRARKATNAWHSLATVDESGIEQAEKFSAWARYRDQVLTGVRRADEKKVREFLDEVENFLNLVEREAGWLPNVA